MDVPITLVVRLPGGTPAGGAEVRAVNHDALTEARREWVGATDAEGTVTWPDAEIGRLGSRITFTARYVDETGERWYVESEGRVYDPTTITMTLDIA